MTGAGRTCALVLLAVVATGGAARATPPTASHASTTDGRHTLGIVEMRTGSAQLPALGERLAALARRATGLSVTGPTDGRKRSGPELDAAVARCAGEPGCLASVGQRLGVRSLLVVAVSQLGDVIVALQLVDVDARKVIGRLAESLPSGRPLGDEELRGCLERVLPRDAFHKWGTLSIRTDVSGARVEIDGQPQGVSPVAPLRLQAPQHYRLLVSKPGREAFSMTVELRPDQTTEVLAKLPEPVEDRPWYKRPSLWVAAVVILAAGTVAGIRFAAPGTNRLDGSVTVIRE